MLLVSIAEVKIGFFGLTSSFLLLDKFLVHGSDGFSWRFDYRDSSASGFVLLEDLGYYCGNQSFFLSKNHDLYALLDENTACVTVSTLSRSQKQIRQNSLLDITLAMLSLCLLKQDVLIVHASLVDLNGEGILFIGKSGIGKTTQAEQWANYRNAIIINGDHVFIRKFVDGFWAYGSPWHGSSPYCENSKSKLRAIVALKQSSANQITRIYGTDAVLEAERSVFLPRWRKDDLSAALDIFSDLMNRIPVYLLECRIDKEAVDITFNQVFGKEN